MDSNRELAKENRPVVRKSIQRYPEISVNQDNLNKQVTIGNNDLLENESKLFHEPRLNKLVELRKTLTDIKNYEARELKNMEDLSKGSQEFINRTVSSKLNFPHSQKVFKNLPKIYGDDQIRQKSAPKRFDSNPKSGKREEIQDYIRQMVEDEYKKESEGGERRGYVNLAGEDEMLGLKKYEPYIVLPNKRTEFQRYHDSMINDLYHTLFNSDDYRSHQIKFIPSLEKKEKAVKDCKCLNDFYTRHSMCS